MFLMNEPLFTRHDEKSLCWNAVLMKNRFDEKSPHLQSHLKTDMMPVLCWALKTLKIFSVFLPLLTGEAIHTSQHRGGGCCLFQVNLFQVQNFFSLLFVSSGLFEPQTTFSFHYDVICIKKWASAIVLCLSFIKCLVWTMIYFLNSSRSSVH